MIETRKSKRKLSTFIGLTVVAFVLLLGLIYISSRRYEGVEFSPYSFQTRPFSYRLGVFSKGTTIVEPGVACCSTDITKHLANSTQTPVALARWDLVRSNSLMQGETLRGEASVLVDALLMLDSNANALIWDKWSADNPELAAVLWPAIQEFAIHHVYFVIPELLMKIPELRTTNLLHQEIAKSSVSAALIQAERLIAMNRSVDAKPVIEWGLSRSESQILQDSPQAIHLLQLLESVSHRKAASN